MKKTHVIKKLGSEKGYLEGRYRFIKSWKGKVIEVGEWIPNMIMKDTNYGVNLIAQALIGETTYPIEITHAKIGTGSTAIAETDHDLETPVVNSILRGDESVGSVNIAHLEFFISDADLANGTYTRWGLFTGTYGVNEKMFVHSVITPSYTKATNQDTTVVHEVTINN